MMYLAFIFAETVPGGRTVGAIAAVIFLLMFLGIAFLAFKALKKTVKFALLLTIIGGILLIALAGSFSLWYFSSDVTPKLKPPAERRR